MDAWVDFNNNGIFEASEQIISLGEADAGEVSFPVDVPPLAFLGSVPARFRFSNAGGLGPTGLAPDGEVEDYMVEIDSLTSGVPEITPPGGDIVINENVLGVWDFEAVDDQDREGAGLTYGLAGGVDQGLLPSMPPPVSCRSALPPTLSSLAMTMATIAMRWRPLSQTPQEALMSRR